MSSSKNVNTENSSVNNNSGTSSNRNTKITSAQNTVNAQTRAAADTPKQSERRDGPGGN